MLPRGEERLFAAMERGVIPPAVAMEIARSKEADVQASLSEVYEAGALPGNQIVAIRRIIEQRNSIGKGVKSSQGCHQKKSKQVSASALVRSYRKETERQRLLVKKATLAQSRLVFIVNALRRLLADEHFTTLLRAENIQSLPRPLAERMEAASAG
jgi:ParB family chromosome partitioning protein